MYILGVSITHETGNTLNIFSYKISKFNVFQYTYNHIQTQLAKP